MGGQGGARVDGSRTEAEGGQVGDPESDPGTQRPWRPSLAAAGRDGEAGGGPPARVMQGTSPASWINSMCTVKVLALWASGCQLRAVLNTLRWFPHLEKLYVTLYHRKKTEPQYDPQLPIKCLQTHLKEVVLKSSKGSEEQVDFARFFVLNAQVLKKIEFQVRGNYSNESVASQQILLQLENRASRDAQFEFWSNCARTNEFLLEKHIHDLSVADPFRQP